MSAQELLCPRCGAPAPASTPSVYTCGYCGATVRNQEKPAAVAPAANASEAFRAAFEAARGSGEFRAALEHAIAKALGPETNPRAFANAMIALCVRFRQESGIEIRGDAQALARVFAGWSHVKSGMNAEVNLPFLSAGPSGPAHLAVGPLDDAAIEALERG